MKKRQLKQCDGFTLIETVVVIVMAGVITAGVMVNWASFMRHQELRGDAINLHKEILALKAIAIENGHADTLRCSGDSCTLRWSVPNENDTGYSLREKKFKMNKGVVIDIGANNGNWGGLTQITPHDAWKGHVSTVKIVVTPNSIDAYDKWNGDTALSSANGARLVLSSAKVKARYCIQKDPTGIRPELYYQSKAGGVWTRM
jgi:prepilin-type N-terminal cleavage/methylation domain-containing protein